MTVKLIILFSLTSFLEVGGAPSWPSWATQTIPTCPKGTKYTVRTTWSGATYGICFEKPKKDSGKPEKATAGRRSSQQQAVSARNSGLISTVVEEKATIKKTKYAEKPTAETSTMKTRRTSTMAAPPPPPTTTINALTANTKARVFKTTTESTLSTSVPTMSENSETLPSRAKVETDFGMDHSEVSTRSSVKDVKGNSLGQNDSHEQEKIFENMITRNNQEPTTTTKNNLPQPPPTTTIKNNQELTTTTTTTKYNPQGLAFIDFDYNSDPAKKRESIEFDLTFGGNFYAFDYDHVFFPKNPKAGVLVP